MKTTILLSILICFISCKDKNIANDQLGEVRIDVSGSSEAKKYFEKGLLLLHSFEYEDAREAFQEAQKIDPKMPMAYWGEAMTYNHSLWSEQDFEKGTEALTSLQSLDYERISNPLEKDLITAVHLLYQPKMEKPSRDIAYSEYMEELTRKYPNNHEVAAFYALSLLGSVEDGRDVEIYGKGAQIAQGILKENPNHPGALHYLIHSYDDPEHATLALDAAHAYAKVAPDASHALHMPSHIFVAMGMWNNVIASNIDSYEASLHRMERKNLGGDARGYHAFHWLQYGYLQNDEKERAKQMVHEMEGFVADNPSVRARIHLVFLKGTYLVETNEWNSAISDIPVDISDLNITIRTQHHFLDGMKAYANADVQQLAQIIAIMEKDINRASSVLTYGKSSLCSNVSRQEATPSDIVESNIRMLQLKGLHANLNSNYELAEEQLLASIELEEQISYSYGPPMIQKPTYELYADWLLEQKRYEEAEAAYEQALKKAPKRRSLMMGVENAKNQLASI